MSYYKVLGALGVVAASPALVVLFYVLRAVAQLLVRYALRRGAFAHVHRAPGFLSWAVLFEQGGVAKLRDMLRKGGTSEGDGEFHDATLLGPYSDGAPYITFANADAVRDITSDLDTFPKHPAGYDPVKMLLGDGLVTSTGAVWKRQRRLLTPLFHGRRLKSYLPTINDEARALCVRIAARNGVASSPVDDFNTVTLRVAVRSVLGEGLEPAELMANFKAAVAAVIAVMGMAMFVPPHVVTKYFAFVPFVRRFNTSVRELRASVARLIAVRREHLARGGADDDGASFDGLLEAMLAVRDEDGRGIDTEKIIDETITALFAAHDTTSNTLSWAMYALSKHRDVQAKVAAEARAALAADHDELDAARLPYARAVINEVLRLFGPVSMLDRVAARDTVVCGVRVPAGTAVAMQLDAVARNAKYWGAQPEAFIPERWQSDDVRARHPFAFAPFSANSRNCIGSRLALQEAAVVLAHVVGRYEVEHVNEPKATFVGTIEPLGMLVKHRARDAGKNVDRIDDVYDQAS